VWRRPRLAGGGSTRLEAAQYTGSVEGDVVDEVGGLVVGGEVLGGAVLGGVVPGGTVVRGEVVVE
jgi:hypothetical protein